MQVNLTLWPLPNSKEPSDDNIDSDRPGASDLQKRHPPAPWYPTRGKIELDLLPDGRGMLKASRTTGTIGSFIGLLAHQTSKVATIEEMNEATARAWAGKA